MHGNQGEESFGEGRQENDRYKDEPEDEDGDGSNPARPNLATPY